MEDIYNLNPTNTTIVAKELTVKAIENGLILASADAAETAQSVLDFYHTIIEHLND